MQAQPGNLSNLSAMIDMLGGPATGPSGATGATAPAPAAAAAAGLQTPAKVPAREQAGGATLGGATSTTSAPTTLLQTPAADGALAPRMPRRMSEMPLLRPPIAAIWGYRLDAFATAHRFERHALGHARRLGPAWRGLMMRTPTRPVTDLAQKVERPGGAGQCAPTPFVRPPDDGHGRAERRPHPTYAGLDSDHRYGDRSRSRMVRPPVRRARGTAPVLPYGLPVVAPTPPARRPLG